MDSPICPGFKLCVVRTVSYLLLSLGSQLQCHIFLLYMQNIKHPEDQITTQVQVLIPQCTSNQILQCNKGIAVKFTFSQQHIDRHRRLAVDTQIVNTSLQLRVATIDIATSLDIVTATANCLYSIPSVSVDSTALRYCASILCSVTSATS